MKQKAENEASRQNPNLRIFEAKLRFALIGLLR
jgi:hypothetical protein